MPMTYAQERLQKLGTPARARPYHQHHIVRVQPDFVAWNRFTQVLV
jgi:hypothetical protein